MRTTASEHSFHERFGALLLETEPGISTQPLVQLGLIKALKGCFWYHVSSAMLVGWLLVPWLQVAKANLWMMNRHRTGRWDRTANDDADSSMMLRIPSCGHWRQPMASRWPDEDDDSSLVFITCEFVVDPSMFEYVLSYCQLKSNITTLVLKPLLSWRHDRSCQIAWCMRCKRRFSGD